jgi:hypothetical protein
MAEAQALAAETPRKRGGAALKVIEKPAVESAAA